MNFVPDYLPLHHDVLRQFHALSAYPKSDMLQDIRNQFEVALVEIVNENTGRYPAHLINELAQEYRSLNVLASEIDAYDRQLQKAKSNYKLETDQCEPITLESWDQYRLNRFKAPSLEQAFTKLDAKTSNSKPDASGDQLEKVFVALPYIWEDPTVMLPEDMATAQQEEDELKFSGGTIELTCPISFQPFKAPMISRKCGHVFDKPALERFLENQTKTCPQGACGQHVNMKDFVPDLVMQFRCLIHTTKKQKTRASPDASTDVVD
ncbi:SUMO ligase MMS21 Ecym_1358 [Eremothecium cymbalariae DBVPG|uniref:SP-RING-type domain-containing protein n=1 Tax=Eremothecium cymbalariae (strain CBS 270.75 / DBVPG 7215 / KCTC 17166 / NRRL Y-17582) TaxID=931890 RepID=G8JNC7_ERECY|nr:hypothetical protein Ecym_1358 [Eremothecium cymbalariae DBVPG\